MGANLERVMGIEPTRPAWKAGILPLNYTRIVSSHYMIPQNFLFVNTFFENFQNFFIFFKKYFLTAYKRTWRQTIKSVGVILARETTMRTNLKISREREPDHGAKKKHSL